MELKTAEEALGKDLAEIYREEYQRLTDRDSDLLYMPATDRAKWWCSCGVMNLISQMHCRVCGASIADLSRIMWKDYLTEIFEKEHPGQTPAPSGDELKAEAEKAAAERAAAERATSEQAAAERAAAEKAAAEKAAAERAAAEKAAAEREAAVERATMEKAVAEQEAAKRAAAERVAAEQAAAEKAAAERAAAAERFAAERAAEKRAAAERAEAERLAEEQAYVEPEQEMLSFEPEPEMTTVTPEPVEPAEELEMLSLESEPEVATVEPELAEPAEEPEVLSVEPEPEQEMLSVEPEPTSEEPEMATETEPEMLSAAPESVESSTEEAESETSSEEPEPVEPAEKSVAESGESGAIPVVIRDPNEPEPEAWSVNSGSGDKDEYRESRLVGTWDAASYFDFPQGMEDDADAEIDYPIMGNAIEADVPGINFPVDMPDDLPEAENNSIHFPEDNAPGVEESRIDFPLEMSEEPEEIESKLTLPTEEPEEEEAKLSLPTEEPEEEEAKLALPTEEPEEEEAKLTHPTEEPEEEEAKLSFPTEEPEEEEAKLSFPTEEPEEEEAKLSFPIGAQDEEEESARLDIPVGNSDEEEESARLDMPVASAEVEEASGLGILTGGDGEESDDKEGYALESVALEKPEEESPEDLKVASSDYFGTDHISSVKKDEEETPVEEVPEDVSFEENEVLEEEPTEPIVEETSIPTSPEGPAEETDLDRLDMNEMFKDEPDGFRFSEPEFKLEEPKNSLPEIHLEKALEMPGFGEVQTLDALPAEESVEFLELPTDDASEEPKKNGLFGGVFKKKQKPARIEPVKTEPKKTWKKPELATEMEEVPEPRPVILEPVEPVAKPTVTRPEPKWVIEEPIISKPEPKEETPEPKAETPEPIVTEPESKAETVESKPEVKATSEPEPEIQGGPKMVFDDEGNPHIVFPEDEAVDNPFSDMDFPDATIPESPMPDPKIIPDVPRVEFPEGPQTELTMNPDPDNKEKARPFRNPEAAERTPSGLTADEDLSKDLSLEASPNPTDRSAEKEPSASFFDDVVEPVGLSPDTMEYDGKNHKQTLLVVAIIIVALAVAGVGFLLFRNYVDSTYTEAIENANVSIARLSEEGIPTQEDFNRAMDDYNAVPYEKKNEVEHADILEKYKDVDLKLVRDIKSRIDSLKDDTPFSDVISVEEEFNRLTMQEKTLIDASRIEQLKTLDDNEKTALQAIKNIQDLLPDFDNFKILTVNVKDDTKMSISHRLKISYSYVDDEGTLTEKTTYISMMSADDDVAYRKAVNEGNPALYTEGTEDKEAYEKCESTEVNVDPNKLSYFLG